MFKCEKCGKEFDNERSFSGHKGACGKKKECPVCCRMISVSNFIAHVKSHENDKACPACGGVVHGRGRFCSKSCAASVNNVGVVRNGVKKKDAFCLTCGKILVRRQVKYCSNHCQQEKKYREYIGRWLIGKETGNMDGCMNISNYVRRWLYETRGKRCEGCGWARKHSMDGSIPIQVEHIDGNAQNTTPENLRILCPSCHSLTLTFGNRNKGKGRSKRRSKRCSKE